VPLPRPSAPLRGVALATLIAAAACTFPEREREPATDPGADLGTSAAAVTGADAIARAEQWVSAQLLYCQSPNHKSDTIDPACPAVCNRTDNAAWDPYRSDCSGLVSWAWGLPAPGRTTYGFAPFATDITTAIQASALAPGDAVNNSDHVMLFKAWAGQQATFVEEPGCSATPDYAHEFTSAVTLSGTQITVAYNAMTFTAIHFDQLGPSCTNACDDAPRVSLAATPTGEGYWIADAAGHVYPDGNARFFGDLTGVALANPVVGVARTPSGGGYWMVAADGGVFSFGDAGFHGSAGGMALNEPVVGMAVTPDGGGYWLAAGDGGVFSFGSAAFYGSAGSVKLNAPVVGIAATPTGQGYWMVASDGGIFAFGDAGFYGSAGGMPLNKPVVGMAPTATGQGYWLVASDGGIFSYGDAGFHGSAGSMPLNQPMVGMSATGDGGGYWMVASDGGVFTYGDAAYLGNGLASGCNAGVPQQCALAASGCFALQNDAACPAGQVCGHGTCQATCTDQCTAGKSQCSGAAAVQVCGSYGTAPCTAWSPATACPAGQTCAGGVCTSPACADDCEPGATECVGGSLATCTAQKAGGCHTWGTPTPCMAGQTCQAGGCTADGSGAGGSTGAGAAGGSTGTGAAGGAGTGNGGAPAGSGSSAGSGAHGSAGSPGGCAIEARGEGGAWAALALALGGLGLRRRRRGC
jgi:MYXO-CTERM domain-containing protein